MDGDAVLWRSEPADLRGPYVHLNMNVRGLRPSATVAINERANALRRSGQQVFKLGLGQSPFPVPDPVGQALQRHAFEKDYLPVQGLWPLREAVADHHHRLFGIQCSPEDVMIGPGSKELMFLMQLTYYGELVIPSPSWVSYAPQARILGRTINMIETRRATGWKITPDQLDAACRIDPLRPRLLVLNYPSNPTGQTYTRDELAELAEVARRYQVLVLSDEIYGKLHHDNRHMSMVPLYPDGTIYSGGLSKWCGAGGWRLGVFVLPKTVRWLRDALAAVASETFTSTSAPIQHAAITAFEGGPSIDRYLRSSQRVLRSLGRHVAQQLTECGVEVDLPEGGFYSFPDFSPLAESLARRGIGSSRQLCELLLQETGVAILPGEDFGRPAGELTARLAYVDFDGSRALAALEDADEGRELRADFLRTYCGPTMEAIDRLCDWLAHG